MTVNKSLLLHGGKLFTTLYTGQEGWLIGSNGTGGLSNSGQTAVDLGVTNLKYGVNHIDTAQVCCYQVLRW
jgi:diketogulonate reductase-like aldo/keto reductase